MASPMYARLAYNKLSIDPRQEANKNLRLAQKHYKKDYDWRACLASIFKVCDYALLNKSLLFHSASVQPAAKRYEKQLPR